ncbi:MAG TPA: RagB/SusD family nutrient uptake outer membrane protein [Gemmatimonadaceae bacterium]|nr:RagB/SusD family nutrient uptake outer membrane protein [Gemmatimonadaceae bacterium]
MKNSLKSTVLGVGLIMAASACNIGDLLDVDDPDVATPGSLTGEDALPVLLAGAFGDFQLAYSGDNAGVTEGLVNLGGLLADEFEIAESFPTRVPIDRRDIDNVNTTLNTAYSYVHRARAAAELSARRHQEFAPNTSGHALSLAIAAYSYILLGENFCSGVPVSTLTDAGGTEFGPPLSTQELFTEAIERFDAAIAASEADTPEQYLAMVGKARALLNLDRPADAAAVAADVPDDFVFHIQHSDNTARQENGVFAYVNIQGRWTVADNEGGTGLPYRSAADPRVTFELDPDDGVGFDGVTPMFHQLKYPERDVDVVLASGTEARLIEAEAQLAAGNTTGWLGTLNALRTAAGLGQLTDPGTPAARVDLMFRERAFWLWLTAHRLGDLRRLVRQYDRTAASVFPTGAYSQGGTYGNDVSLPIPFEELNNPLAQECDASVP